MADDNCESLDSVVQDAVASWLAENGGGFLGAYVLAADIIDADGDRANVVVEGQDQPRSSSLGLSAYASNMFSELQRRDLFEFLDSEDD